MTSWQMGAVGAVMLWTGRPVFATKLGARWWLRSPKWPPRPPRVVTRDCPVGARDVAGFRVYTVEPPSGTRELGSVVFLHGGAYTGQLVPRQWAVVTQLARETGRAVHVPVYGLAPQHDGLEALAFVRAVAAELPVGEPVHLVGESSGGGLALLLAQHWPETAPPLTGASLISPWLDLAMTNPGIDEAERRDPLLARPGLHVIAEAWARGLALEDPRLSPIRGRLDDLPPIGIWVGERDLTQPDSRLLFDRLGPERARYHEEPGGLHVYPLLRVPEGRAARTAIIGFVRETLDGPARH